MSSFKEDFRNVWRKPNNTLVQLIVVNVAVWLAINLALLFTGTPSLQHTPFSLYLGVNTQFSDLIYHPWTTLTYMFVHEGIFHIFFNMLMLYWFGQIVDEYLGHRKLLAVYLMGGFFAGLFSVALLSVVGLSGRGFIVGASGSVIAIVVAAATLLPDFRMHLLLLGPVKLRYIALGLVVISVVQSRLGNTGGEFAHIGGAVFGFLFIRQLQRGVDWGKPVDWTADFFANLFKKKSKMNVSYRKKQQQTASTGKAPNGKSASASNGDPDQDTVDRILDKISEKGYEKLTKEEKKILFRASKDKDKGGK